ncbi:hypothetical protein [Cupriavidus sp. YAF13]|uniref:hypothetical protein n=1 Tax=Cupriavidus sp. YAF13 TaxID=3233075 RepID=UPI003F9291C8
MTEIRYRYYVVTLIAISVTALLGWLFSLWKPKDSAEVASWVQAVGSILAVAVAALIPFIHTRLMERRLQASRMESLRILANLAVHLMSDLRAAFATEVAMWNYTASRNLLDWDEAAGTLATFPVWDVADVDVVKYLGPIRDALRVCREIAHMLPLEVNSPAFGKAQLDVGGSLVSAQICADWIAELAGFASYREGK